ncbi:hypothetical protein P7K49_024833 [Saguinus oedipus]|uniref:Uncharacterized protein n=1 Tax=Saguinus oedipus TaxID=9490 RepID=A0ABQ9USX4_SAGOE|nr:hypothetical protein P7K49_024833 [Saguinus oedipus]
MTSIVLGPLQEDLHRPGTSARGPPSSWDLCKRTSIVLGPLQEDLHRPGTSARGPPSSWDLCKRTSIVLGPLQEDLHRPGTSARGPPEEESDVIPLFLWVSLYDEYFSLKLYLDAGPLKLNKDNRQTVQDVRGTSVNAVRETPRPAVEADENPSETPLPTGLGTSYEPEPPNLRPLLLPHSLLGNI